MVEAATKEHPSAHEHCTTELFYSESDVCTQPNTHHPTARGVAGSPAERCSQITEAFYWGCCDMALGSGIFFSAAIATPKGMQTRGRDVPCHTIHVICAQHS